MNPSFTLRPSLAVLLLALLPLGCSEMKFVNAPAPTQKTYDPRRDIQLSGVLAESTSGTVLLRQIQSEKALFSEDRGVLEMDQVRVRTYRNDGRLQGITRAQQATFFMSDQPTSSPARRDMIFDGQVRYRAPAVDNPSTDALQLTTEKLLWDERAQLFRCPTTFNMVVTSPGKPPMRMGGREFITTRDLSSFTFGSGSLSSRPDIANVTKSLSQLGKELQAEAAGLEKRYPDRPHPTPIPIPQVTEGFPAQNLLQQAEQLQNTMPPPAPPGQGR